LEVAGARVMFVGYVIWSLKVVILRGFEVIDEFFKRHENG